MDNSRYILLIIIALVIGVTHHKPVEHTPVQQAHDLPVEISEPKTVHVEKIDLGTFTITAYCPCEDCCDESADGITYSGTKATEGRTIAVDPDVIPLGSVVEINGAEYIAEDIGGEIKGNNIDLFFNSHEDALHYGVQNHKVYLIDKFF